jgi:hypothetical protein
MAEQPGKQGSDEIDLGQLLQLIGNGIRKVFNFFLTLLKSLAHALIIILIFLRRNFILLFLSVLVGGIGGYFVDQYMPTTYVSRMVVEPNFNSARQLYNNIGFYNDMARAKDSVALSKALKIEISEAASIKEIFVDSYTDENQKIRLFDDFIKGLDTTTISVIDYESYLSNFNSMDARFHQISVISTNNLVAKKAQPSIVRSISSNSYFRLQKRINDENIKIQDSIILRQLVELDSLQNLYKTILVKEAERPMPGTSISLADNGTSQNKELAIISEREELKSLLVQLNREKANKGSILNVISDFPDRGVERKGYWYSYKMILPTFLLAVVILILLAIRVNKYLKNYKGEILS